MRGALGVDEQPHPAGCDGLLAADTAPLLTLARTRFCVCLTVCLHAAALWPWRCHLSSHAVSSISGTASTFGPWIRSAMRGAPGDEESSRILPFVMGCSPLTQQPLLTLARTRNCVCPNSFVYMLVPLF